MKTLCIGQYWPLFEGYWKAMQQDATRWPLTRYPTEWAVFDRLEKGN